MDCRGVGLGLASSGEVVPAAGVKPILAVFGGVNVDGEDNYLIVAELPTDGVYAAVWSLAFSGSPDQNVAYFWKSKCP